MKYFLLLFFLCSSCSSKAEPKGWVETFKDYGKFKTVIIDDKPITTHDKDVHSFRFNGLDLIDVLKTVQDITGISIVCDTKLDDRKITAFYKEKKISVILESLGRRVDASVTQLGSVWYIGKLKPEDRATYITNAPAGDVDVINKAVSSMLSNSGSSVVVSGSIIITDHLDNLRKAVETLNDHKRRSVSRYFASVYFIRVSNSDILKLGVDLEVNAIDLLDKPSGARLFKALIQANYDHADAEVLINPTMMLAEGLESKLRRGREVPLENKITTENGTVETKGYETVTDGLTLSLTCRRLDNDLYNLNFDMEVSAFDDLNVTGRPIKDTRSIVSNLIIKDAEVLLVGSVNSISILDRASIVKFETNNTKEVILIFVCVKEFDRSNVMELQLPRK